MKVLFLGKVAKEYLRAHEPVHILFMEAKQRTPLVRFCGTTRRGVLWRDVVRFSKPFFF